MKKFKICLIMLFLAGISVYAFWERRLVTPEQELALQSLANRYLDAFCENPRALAAVASQNSTLARTILSRTADYLEELVEQEGSCYGHNKRTLKNEILGSIYDLADFIVDNEMATEFGVSDFYDCLVDIERSFVDLSDSTTRIFECVNLLDIRGFWYHALVYQPPTEYPLPPVEVLPPAIPIPAQPWPVEDLCYQECYDSCLGNSLPPPAPAVPVPAPTLPGNEPAPNEPAPPASAN